MQLNSFETSGSSPTPFYVYLWQREDGTPYYVGKGTGNRAYAIHRGRSAIRKAPSKECVVIYPVKSEQDAFETEIALIWYYGRKDNGTGCLRNYTDGGEGASGHIRSDSTKLKKQNRQDGKTA